MANFNDMKCVFEVVESNNEYFEAGDRFKVKRFESGAFAYGDRSAHTIDCDNEVQIHRYYDTRYAGISTNTPVWRNYWKSYIEKEFNVKVKLIING